MKKLLLIITGVFKKYYINHKKWSKACHIYDLEKWIKNEPEKIDEYNELCSKLIGNSFRLISRLKRGEIVTEEEQNAHISAIKMMHLAFKLKPFGKYIDLKDLRDKLNP